MDKKGFEKWHAKTVDKTNGDYRKKLINRVNSSKKLTRSRTSKRFHLNVKFMKMDQGTKS